MNGFNTGLELGVTIVKWLMNVLGGTIGFLLPFLAVLLLLLPALLVVGWVLSISAEEQS